MAKCFAVLGSGMQGTAAAYDVIKFSSPGRLKLGDYQLSQAQKAEARLRELTGFSNLESCQVDALNPASLAAFLQGVDVLLACLPWWMYTEVAKVAIETGTSMVDLGGNTDTTQATLDLHEQAKAAGVTIVPDTGLAPGLVNNIGVALIDEFDEAESVNLYCGVLPMNPIPPLNYMMTFHVDGLVGEYDLSGIILRDGKIHYVKTLGELEEIQVEGVGQMEAFVTSGGVSTAPFSLQGRVKNYEYKTVRYPGHCAIMQVFRDYGFWSTEPVTVGESAVVPREFFCKVFGDSLGKIKDRDLCIVRGVGVGIKGGKRRRIQLDILDHQDPATGFTSMERMTGFSMAIYAGEIAAGRCEAGCLRYELAVPGARMLDEIRKRGIEIKRSESEV
ncbi:MAG: saccharopine dehydrogenase NADP-binding domain-containing protein [Armatimonadetes bacterium]|nr:saccharopine dehydrogenase NADP-binding domain-containing protein [Armatimonadota bacterium]